MTKFANLFVCDQLAIPAILGFDFCNQFMEYIYPKTPLVELVDASTVPIVRQHDMKQLVNSENLKYVSFSKQKRHVSLDIPPTQLMHTHLFSQAINRYNQNEKSCYSLLSKHSSKKAWNVDLLAESDKLNATYPFASWLQMFLERVRWSSKAKLVPRPKKHQRYWWPKKEKPQ